MFIFLPFAPLIQGDIFVMPPNSVKTFYCKFTTPIKVSLFAIWPHALREHSLRTRSVPHRSGGLLPMPSLIVRDSKGGAVLTIHVQPKAARTACIGIHGEALKIRVAAPPVEGAANRELMRFLARELSLPVAAVHIESGGRGRYKRVRLEGRTSLQVMTRLMPTHTEKP